MELQERSKQELMNKLRNGNERFVGAFDQDLGSTYEARRYEWARDQLLKLNKPLRVLEVGCSSAYGLNYLKDVPNLDYTGIDVDLPVLEFAREEFGARIPNTRFLQQDINRGLTEHYDAIIAFEVIEHLDHGLDIVQILKQHCDILLITIPNNEPYGALGMEGFHKLYSLTPYFFPGFEIEFLIPGGTFVKENPCKELTWIDVDGKRMWRWNFTMMLLKWSKT